MRTSLTAGGTDVVITRWIALLALALGATTAQGASELPDPYACKTVEGRCSGSDGRYPVQYVSLSDGAPDYYFVRFPDGYDKDRTYPLLIHFHPYCAGLSTIADPRMLRQVSNDNQVIFLGHWQRGGEGDACGASYLGDGKAESPQAAQAAREDMRELLNELTAHFKISYIITAGASMGGYTALRMAMLFPDKVHVSLTSVAAMFEQHNIFPEPTLILQAAQDGVYDDRLVYTVVGSDDFSIKAHRRLDSVLQGKTHWSYHELAGQGHISVFSDDWNVARGHCKDPNLPDSHCWYISTPDTPLLWQEVRRWEEAHPDIAGGTLEPDCGWVEPATPADRYLTAELAALGGRSWPRPTIWCSSSNADAPAASKEASVATDLAAAPEDAAVAAVDSSVSARPPSSSSCMLTTAGSEVAGAVVLVLIVLFGLWHGGRRRQSSVSRCEHVSTAAVQRIRLQSGRTCHDQGPLLRQVAGSLTIRQISETLGVKRSWIYNGIRRGRIDIQRDEATRLYIFPDRSETIEQLRQLKAGCLAHVKIAYTQEHQGEQCERLLRYGLRPPFAQRRLALTADGKDGSR